MLIPAYIADHRLVGGVMARLGGERGFTLLEILVAMAVFAIMAGMAYAGLHSVFESRRATESRAEALAQWQRLVFMVNEDLTQALPREVRDELGGAQLSMIGGNDERMLILTRAVADWNGQSLHNVLQRVEYRRQADGVYRQVWQVLDRTQQTGWRRRKLLSGVAIDIRFYGTSWGSVWPAAGGGLPRAVEISGDFPELGRLRRVFILKP